jgi:hypothetical protein
VVTFVVMVGLGLAACGGGDGIGDAASAQLVAQVQSVRGAVERGDAGTAAARLDELRQHVTQLRDAGELDDAQAAEVLVASAEVEAQLASLSPASAVTSAASPSSEPASSTTSTTSDEQRTPDEKDQKKAKNEHRKGDE